MNEFVLARVVHVLCVILWIGGLAMVTTILLPVTMSMPSEEKKAEFFKRFKKRFAAQARYTTLFTGLSGFYMVHILDAWSRFTELRYWWMHSMVIIWLLFMFMLYVMEPRILHSKIKKQTQQNSNTVFIAMQRTHWILLLFSLITVIGATAGSHGWMLSEG